VLVGSPDPTRRFPSFSTRSGDLAGTESQKIC
jgi:hypothetical protein